MSPEQAMERQTLAGLQQAAEAMTAAVQRALADEQQFFRYVYSPRGEAPAEVVLQKADTRAMKELAAALKELAGAVRAMQELPGDPEREEEAAPEGMRGVILLGGSEADLQET